MEDADDFERHFDYVHYNPVKQGYVRCPRDWPWSRFHRSVHRGVSPEDWACWREGRGVNVSNIEESLGE